MLKKGRQKKKNLKSFVNCQKLATFVAIFSIADKPPGATRPSGAVSATVK